MRKIYSTLAVCTLCSITTTHAQGLLDRARQKAKDKLTPKEVVSTPPASGGSVAITPISSAPPVNKGGEFGDDPAPYGKILFPHVTNYTQEVRFPQIMSGSAPGGQLQLQIAYNDKLSYANGQLTKMPGDPYTESFQLYTNTEADGRCVDMSGDDYMAFMSKKGPSITGGKNGTYTYTFKGKTFATLRMAMGIRRNADSSVIMVSGMNMSNKYELATSLGQRVELPTLAMFFFMSPDGSHSAAMIQNATAADAMTNAKVTCYITGAPAPVTISRGDSHDIWLHNNGTMYSINAANTKELLANDKPFHTFDEKADSKDIYISKDGKRLAWVTGYNGLHFSDGKVFNATSATRVTINGKEMMVFLVLKNGDGYLCQKEL